MPRAKKAVAASVPAQVPSSQRFQVINDDIVLDTATGKEYSRQASITPSMVTWTQAKAACKKLDLGGHKDWRLPTRVELLTLVDDTRFNPAIDPAFECKSDWFWTSTLDVESPSVFAWLVYFGSGYSGRLFQSSFGWVRAVRVGQ